MKNKILLFIFILVLLFSFDIKDTIAEESEWNVVMLSNGSTMSYETLNGDMVEFQKRLNKYEYRIVISDNKIMNLDLKNKRIGKVNFLESTSFYYFYGSVYNDYDSGNKDTTPFILRFEKNFTNLSYYYDKDVSGQAHVDSLFEFGANNMVSLEFVQGTHSFSEYIGLYRLFQYDEDMNVISSIDVGEHANKPCIAYDRIDYMNPDGSHIYFDKEFNQVPKYDSFTVSGHYELLCSCKVNGVDCLVGSVFSDPGIYELDDGIHNPITVTISANINLTGQKINDVYKDYVEYKVTGGNVMINEEPVYLNGIVSRPGKYKLKVSGLNGYINEVDFIVSPELYTEIENGGTLSIGDTIQFSGTAKLNGTEVSSGYVLKEAGSYVLDLCADDIVIEEIIFTVPELFVTNESKTRIYIVMGAIIILIVAGLTTSLILVKRRK